MNINVTPTKVEITSEQIINKGEYHINDCEFTFSQEYDDLIKRAVFTDGLGKSYVVEIEDDICIIPENVLRFYDKCILGVYAYENSEDELLLRYSPEPTTFKLNKGSYVSDAEHYVPVKPVKDLIDEYNQNAIEKTNEFNQNFNTSIERFDEHVENKSSHFDEHVADKIDEFDEHIQGAKDEFNQNATEKTNAFNTNAQEKTNVFNTNAQEKTDELNQIAEGIEDMTTAIQFATFEVDNNMGLYIVQADKLINTNFIFNPETGGLEVMIV